MVRRVVHSIAFMLAASAPISAAQPWKGRCLHTSVLLEERVHTLNALRITMHARAAECDAKIAGAVSSALRLCNEIGATRRLPALVNNLKKIAHLIERVTAANTPQELIDDLMHICRMHIAYAYLMMMNRLFLDALDVIEQELAYWRAQADRTIGYYLSTWPHRWFSSARKVDHMITRLDALRARYCKHVGRHAHLLGSMPHNDKEAHAWTVHVLSLIGDDAVRYCMDDAVTECCSLAHDLQLHAERMRDKVTHVLVACKPPHHVERCWGRYAGLGASLAAISAFFYSNRAEIPLWIERLKRNLPDKLRGAFINPGRAFKESLLHDKKAEQEEFAQMQYELDRKKDAYAKQVKDYFAQIDEPCGPQELDAIAQRICAFDASDMFKELDRLKKKTGERTIFGKVYYTTDDWFPFIKLMLKGMYLYAHDRRIANEPNIRHQIRSNKLALAIGPAMPVYTIIGAIGATLYTTYKLTFPDIDYGPLHSALKELYELFAQTECLQTLSWEEHGRGMHLIDQLKRLCRRVPAGQRARFKRDIDRLASPVIPPAQKRGIIDNMRAYYFFLKS